MKRKRTENAQQISQPKPPIKIIYLDRNSPASKKRQTDKGCFGKVYKIPFCGTQIVIKSFDIANTEPK